MTELYPLIKGSVVKGVLGLGGDSLLTCVEGYGCRYFMWVSSDEAVEVTDLVRGRGVDVGLGLVPIASWVRSAPYVHARSLKTVRECVGWVIRTVKSAGMIKQLAKSTVLTGLSGGKDSVTAAVVIDELSLRVPLKLKPMYVYVPYIDSLTSRRFIEERVSKALSAELIIESPKGRDVRRYLKWRGMPRRGLRWCTYFKVKPMREFMKLNQEAVEVVADRVTESLKRAWKLIKFASERLVLAGRRFRPTYLMTLLDVLGIVKSLNLIHPHYMEGCPRVACALCPYKSLHELHEGVWRDVEDAGLIEEVLRRDWSKRYSGLGISYEDFRSGALWRFTPKLAKLVNELRRRLVRDEGRERVGRGEVVNYLRKAWNQSLNIKAPQVRSPWIIAEAVSKGLSEGWVAVTFRGGKPVAMDEVFKPSKHLLNPE